MNGALYFARTRRWGLNLILAVASGAAILLCGPFAYSLNPQDGYRVVIAAQVPLVCAVTIQASLSTPLRLKEAASARRLGRWRLLHIVVLTAVSAVICGVATSPLTLPAGMTAGDLSHLGPTAIVRNLIALNGAAFAAAALTGPAFAWTFPFAWAILPYVALPSRSADPGGILTLLTQPDEAFRPFVVAVVLWIIGAVLATNDWSLDRAFSRM